jgi:hypothetical protein
MWQVEQSLLLQELNSLITTASKTVDLGDVTQLDQIAILQLFKQQVMLAPDEATFHTLAEQWQQTKSEQKAVTIRDVITL